MTTFASVMDKNTVETRGAKAKYNFNLEVNQSIFFPAKEANRVRSALNAYILRKQLDWKIKTWTENKMIFLKRIK